VIAAFPGRSAARQRCAAEPGSTLCGRLGSRLCGAAFHAAPGPGHGSITAADRSPRRIPS
jgi:hypothetical protein